MAVGLAPIFMKNAKLTLGDYATGDAFECQLRSIVLTPDANVSRVKTLCPEGQFSEVEDPEWSLELGYLGMTVTTAGDAVALADYLLEHHGEKIQFYFEPTKGKGSGYGGTATLIVGAVGGEQGSFSEQSVSLPVDGQPVKYDATTGPGTDPLGRPAGSGVDTIDADAGDGLVI